MRAKHNHLQAGFGFAGFALVFLSIGSALFYKSEQVKEEVLKYDSHCGVPILPPFEENINPNDCIIPFEIQNEWTGRVNVYYQMTNFFQNHKDYKNSRNDQ